MEPEIVLNFAGGPGRPWNHCFLARVGREAEQPCARVDEFNYWVFKPEVHEWFADMGFEYQLRYEKFHIAERIIMLSEPDVFMAFKLRWT